MPPPLQHTTAVQYVNTLSYIATLSIFFVDTPRHCCFQATLSLFRWCRYCRFSPYAAMLPLKYFSPCHCHADAGFSFFHFSCWFLSYACYICCFRWYAAIICHCSLCRRRRHFFSLTPRLRLLPHFTTSRHDSFSLLLFIYAATAFHDVFRRQLLIIAVTLLSPWGEGVTPPCRRHLPPLSPYATRHHKYRQHIRHHCRSRQLSLIFSLAFTAACRFDWYAAEAYIRYICHTLCIWYWCCFAAAIFAYAIFFMPFWYWYNAEYYHIRSLNVEHSHCLYCRHIHAAIFDWVLIFARCFRFRAAFACLCCLSAIVWYARCYTRIHADADAAADCRHDADADITPLRSPDTFLCRLSSIFIRCRYADYAFSLLLRCHYYAIFLLLIFSFDAYAVAAMLSLLSLIIIRWWCWFSTCLRFFFFFFADDYATFLCCGNKTIPYGKYHTYSNSHARLRRCFDTHCHHREHVDEAHVTTTNTIRAASITWHIPIRTVDVDIGAMLSFRARLFLRRCYAFHAFASMVYDTTIRCHLRHAIDFLIFSPFSRRFSFSPPTLRFSSVFDVIFADFITLPLPLFSPCFRFSFSFAAFMPFRRAWCFHWCCWCHWWFTAQHLPPPPLIDLRLLWSAAFDFSLSLLSLSFFALLLRHCCFCRQIFLAFFLSFHRRYIQRHYALFFSPLMPLFAAAVTNTRTTTYAMPLFAAFFRRCFIRLFRHTPLFRRCFLICHRSHTTNKMSQVFFFRAYAGTAAFALITLFAAYVSLLPYVAAAAITPLFRW